MCAKLDISGMEKRVLEGMSNSRMAIQKELFFDKEVQLRQKILCLLQNIFLTEAG
jgi:hypothetical protein